MASKKDKGAANAALGVSDGGVEQAVTRPVGRPSSYSKEVGAAICQRLAMGESLRNICTDETMPCAATVFNWLADEDKKDFLEQYARAREVQADLYAESVIDISDEEVTMIKASKHGEEDAPGEVEVVFDATAVARNRLRIDARKWYASKLAPKKYGDKQQIEHSGEVVTLTDEQRRTRLAELQAKLAGKDD